MPPDAVAEYGGKLVEKLLDVALAGTHVSRAGLELGEVEDVVDKVEKRVCAHEYAVSVLLAPVAVYVLAREELGEANDGVEGRPELVRHHRKEASLRLGVLLGRGCRGVGLHRLALEEPHHVRAVDHDREQHEEHHRDDYPEHLVAGESEHLVDDLALRRRAHEHLLEAHGVNARHRLPQDRDEFGRSGRIREHLEFEHVVLRPVEFRDHRRNRNGEHRLRLERGVSGLLRIGNPEHRLPAHELRLRGVDAGLHLRAYLKPRAALDLGLEEKREAQRVPRLVPYAEWPRGEVDIHRLPRLDPGVEPLRLLER